MKVNLTPDMDIFVQCLALVECMGNLGNMDQDSITIRKVTKNAYGPVANSVIENLPNKNIFVSKGAVLAHLFLALVIPYELQKKDGVGVKNLDLSPAESFLDTALEAQRVNIAKDEYTQREQGRKVSRPIDGCRLLWHIRNSLAHGKFHFETPHNRDNAFIIHDENTRGETFEAVIRADDMIGLSDCLQKVAKDFLYPALTTDL